MSLVALMKYLATLSLSVVDPYYLDEYVLIQLLKVPRLWSRLLLAQVIQHLPPRTGVSDSKS